jgi:hypothetical protein
MQPETRLAALFVRLQMKSPGQGANSDRGLANKG